METKDNKPWHLIRNDNGEWISDEYIVFASSYKTLSNYSSGVGQKFTTAQLLSLYGNFGTALPTTAKVVLETYSGTTLIGTDQKTSIPLKVGTARMKISGSWKKGIPWVKVNGTWHPGIAFPKVSGSWHRGL